MGEIRDAFAAAASMAASAGFDALQVDMGHGYLLAGFLSNNQSDLPGRWRLDARTGTFLRDGTGNGFQINLWR